MDTSAVGGRHLGAVKYTQHRSHAKLARPTPSNSIRQLPRVVRITMTDSYATDSSSEDEEALHCVPRQRVKRYINEITFVEPCFTEADDGFANRKKRVAERKNGKKKKKKPPTTQEHVELEYYNNSCSSSTMFQEDSDSVFHNNDVFFDLQGEQASVPDMFDYPCRVFCEKDDNDVFMDSSVFDFGFSSFSSCWGHHVEDDHFPDIGDIFGSDPLLV